MGIGRFCTNPGNLHISANGGKGGIGQYGGYGTEEDNGGNGGAPGLGGLSGEVTIIGLEKSNPNISVSSLEGSIGKIDIAGSGKNRAINGYNKKGIKSPEMLQPPPFDRAVNSYQSYLRENQIENVREFLLKMFSRLLADTEAVIDLYDIAGLIDEFRELEHQFFKLSPKMSLLPDYQSLLDQITKHAKKLKGSEQLSQDNSNVLRYLYTAALSKIINLKNNINNNLVVDLKKFLETIQTELAAVQKNKKEHFTHGYKKDYVRELKRKIEEAQRYVNDIVSPEINRAIKKLDKKVLKFVDEVVKLQNAAQEEKKKLIKKREIQLEQHWAQSRAEPLPWLQLCPSILQTLIKKTLLKLPNAVKESLSPLKDRVKEQKEILKEKLYDAEKLLVEDRLPDTSAIKEIKDKIKKSNEELTKEINEGTYDTISAEKINTLKDNIKLLSSERSKAKSSEIEKIDDQIKDARKELTKLEQTKDKTYNVDTISETKKKIKDLRLEKVKALQDKKTLADDKKSKQLKVIDRVQNTLSIVETSIDAYKNYRDQQEKIDEIGNLIRSAEEKFKELKQFERGIYETVVPVCRQIEDNVNKVQKQLKGQSSAALAIGKWKIQSTLRSVMKEIKTATNGYQVQSEFLYIFNKLEEGMNVMIELYNIMDEYHDKAELGKLIANINTNPSKVNVTNNSNLSAAVNDLMLVIQNNVIMHDYKVATHAIQRNIFPFAEDVFGPYYLPEILKTNDTNEIVNRVSNELRNLENNRLQSESIIQKRDAYIYKNIVFNSRKGTLKPFYTWKYNEHKSNIGKLLNGQEVVLKADIKYGFKGNAVKFNKIGINFESPNKTTERKLHQQLQGFRVTQIHFGHSFYRCKDRIYMIPSENQTIRYSMTRDDGSNDPAITNEVYNKIAKYEAVLSPYATWKIQLNHDEDDFDELSKYANEMIDLVLEGTGQYLDLNMPGVCNDQLDQYYIRSDNQTEAIEIYEKTPELNLKSVQGVINDLWRSAANLSAIVNEADLEEVEISEPKIEEEVIEHKANQEFENDPKNNFSPELYEKLFEICKNINYSSRALCGNIKPLNHYQQEQEKI
uniref:Uncharacterized protein n=1 Tax=Trichogramma kaykai TaxID=54128 RepID=A0ABD2WYM2_9HYME